MRPGVKMAPVSYRASNQSIQDLIGGQINVACDNFPVAIEQVRAGKLRAIAITSPGRYALAPEIQPNGRDDPPAWSRCPHSVGSVRPTCPPTSSRS